MIRNTHGHNYRSLNHYYRPCDGGSASPTAGRSEDDVQMHLLGDAAGDEEVVPDRVPGRVPDRVENFDLQASQVGRFEIAISTIRNKWSNLHLCGKVFVFLGFVGTVAASVAYYPFLSAAIAALGVGSIFVASCVFSCVGACSARAGEFLPSYAFCFCLPWLAPVYIAPIVSVYAVGLCSTQPH